MPPPHKHPDYNNDGTPDAMDAYPAGGDVLDSDADGLRYTLDSEPLTGRDRGKDRLPDRRDDNPDQNAFEDDDQDGYNNHSDLDPNGRNDLDRDGYKDTGSDIYPFDHDRH